MAGKGVTPKGRRVFLSYRRVDCGSAAELLASDLRRRLRQDCTVFFDQTEIRPGEPWPQRLRDELQRSDVVLVLIGKRWHLAQDEETGERLLERSTDWPRCEIEAAGSSGKVVIPVLVDDVDQVPAKALAKLPESIRYLGERQAVVLRSGLERRGGFDTLLDQLAALGFALGDVAPPVARADLPALYLQAVRRAHARLLPFFPEQQEQALAEVFVELEVRVDERFDERKALHGARTLRGVLLPEDLPAGAPPMRLAVVGEPGAGKSTLARNLARTLADEGRLAVYVSLSKVSPTNWDPFLMAAQAALPTLPDAVVPLRDWLRQECEAGRVVVLFDGLDEVEPGRIDDVAKAIVDLAELQCPKAPVAVFSRPIALDKREIRRRLQVAQVVPLDQVRRTRLLRNLLGGSDAELLERQVADNAALAELCQNPLLLTLTAMVAKHALVDQGPLPARRGALYDAAIGLLLRRGHCAEPRGVREPEAARRVLRVLSMRLQVLGRESWSDAALDEHIWAVRQADPGLNFQIKETWDTNVKFLQDVGHNGGVMGPHDVQPSPWRFLHRSLREYLTAEYLAGEGEAVLRQRIEGWVREIEEAAQAKLALKSVEESASPGAAMRPNPERWAEVYALLCGKVADPFFVLGAIAEANQALALRAVQQVEMLPARDGLEFALGLPGCDGDVLVRLCRNWGLSADSVRSVLWPRVHQEASTERLAHYYYALSAYGCKGLRERFFTACRRPLNQVPEMSWRRIPGGTFDMGSPYDEPERDSDEGPQHQVVVCEFMMSRYAVTNAQYQRFDPRHRPSRGSGNIAELAEHPVVNVNWWEAYLFCAWAGCRLPSESEWEFACRAGTKTPFAFGNNVGPQKVNYDGRYAYAGAGKGEYRAQTVPVGTLPPNAFDLHEMHGNAREWCEDRWHPNYEGAPADGSAWLTGSSGDRVSRGGSWHSTASRCRSAYRSRRPAGLRNGRLGFRPACSLFVTVPASE